MNLKPNELFRVVVLLLGGILANTYGLSWIPWHSFHLSPFWLSVLVRGASSIMTLVGIYFFCSTALKRFRLTGELKKVGISLLVVAYLFGPELLHINLHGVTFLDFVASFVFALFIGIEEDFFSRGFIFGVLEKYGVWFAAIVSSVIFGLSHLTNIVWGHQSASYTIAQAANAAAFGFLAVGLMVYSGTIWIPILMHGLADFPMQFESEPVYTKIVTGQGDWVGAALDIVIYVAIGCVLINRRSSTKIQSRVRDIFIENY